MDRAKPLPTLPALEAQEVRTLLPTIPEVVVLDTHACVKQFFEHLPRGAWEPDDEWMLDTVRYMLEYIADLPSSEELLCDYALQVIAELETLGLKFTKDYVQMVVEDFGQELRQALLRAGMYQYKGALLYQLERFEGFDIVLRRLSENQIPWATSFQPGEPGRRAV